MTITINEYLSIDEDDIQFQFVRGGGPGGQNVNKLATRVILYFDIENSNSLTDDQANILRQKLKTRLSKDGVLQLSSHKYRSQLANREDVLDRFVDIIRKAFVKKVKRIKTRIPRAVKRRRLDDKKKLGIKKEMRRTKDDRD